MQVREKVSSALSMPKEILLNLPLITATGYEEINIENYKNLVEFTENKIRILTNAGLLTIDGQKLLLKQITTENIMVTGRISGMHW